MKIKTIKSADMHTKDLLKESEEYKVIAFLSTSQAQSIQFGETFKRKFIKNYYNLTLTGIGENIHLKSLCTRLLIG